ncbi:ATP-NAD kinase family protein [Desulfosporosinus sp. SYSU MS00001]|uniref:ATP-NAD kinase family protein n=1 Tax=Desulfosporosinus sp. SYSU MS00001 TaxID=3416284 RepID=UPI003CFA265C
MASVGIIANPASGKDIRRLVAYGICFDNLEKVNIVKRCLLALAVTGVDRVVYMPDYYGIVPRAVEGLAKDHHLSLDIVEADMEMTGTQIDSAQAALAMNQAGIGCIITLGGDGTNRMVAKSCGDVPLLPISTGTNNVFPQMVEGTIAGLAAGAVVCGLADSPAVHRTKKIIVLKNGKPVDMALIDAVVLKDIFIGSRAIWDEERIRKVVVTRGEPDNIGISSIAGNLHPIGITESKGMAIDLGPGNISLMAPLAPGLIRPIQVAAYKILEIGEEINGEKGPLVIALDGEREVEVGEGEEVSFQLTFEGPRVADPRLVLRQAVAKGYSQGEQAMKKLHWLKEEN